MTEQDLTWFENLHNSRNNIANTLKDSFAIGNIWNSVVEKYSDQAHFIYELLQNADDVQATKAYFNLTVDGLYFTHNGKKNFWISNPDSEKEDQINHKLGDINAITAVAQSNKKDQSTIGKFGVGFKAVYTYTDTPHIFDKKFQFKIERFIVPVLLDNDLPNRKEDETTFFFPFDKSDMPKKRAYEEILVKLKRLVYPTLFLSNLEKISWSTFNESGFYRKEIVESNLYQDIKLDLINLFQNNNQNQVVERIALFSRSLQDEKLNVCVGFFQDEELNLKPKQLPAFCYFPTKENTNLYYIINAPFLLTDSREGLKRSEQHNIKMIEYLSQLSADCLLILRDLKLISSDIFKILPYKDPEEDDLFAPFFYKLKEKFKTEELLPSYNGTYAKRENAYWASAPNLTELFSNQQLSILVNNENAKWVFTKSGYSYTMNVDYELAYHINSIVGNPIVYPKTIFNLIKEDFIENQSTEWLHSFYAYLFENKSYQDDVKTKPIFWDINFKAVKAYELDNSSKKYELVLFLPGAHANSPYKQIHPSLLENPITKDFIEKFGIKKPNLRDEIYNVILPLYDIGGAIDTDSHFQKFFKYFKDECPQNEIDSFIDLIKNEEFVSYRTKDKNITYRGVAKDIYYPNDILLKYFENKSDTWFVYLDDYQDYLTNDNDEKLLKDFLIRIGVNELPKIFENKINDHVIKQSLNLYQSTHGYYDRNITKDKIIDGCSEIIQNIDFDKSILLSKILSELVNKYQSDSRINIETALRGEHEYFYYSYRIQYFESTELTRLRNSKWLYSRNNEQVAPHEISVAELAEGYEINDGLEKLLGFKPSVILTEKDKIAKLFSDEKEAQLAKKLLDEYKAKANGIQATIDQRIYSSTDLDNVEIENDKVIHSKIEQTIIDLESLQKAFKPKQKTPKVEGEESKEISDSIFDEDEEMSKGVEELKLYLETKKNRAKLVEAINNSQKYSYEWFKAYLKLLSTYGEKPDSKKQKTISFQEIKAYKEDNQYFILRGADNYISSEIENAEDFKINLIFKNGEKEIITVEGVSKKGQDLLIFCRRGISNNILSRFPNIYKIEIRFIPVIALLDRLYNAFVNLNNVDIWEDINESMPSLKYIYGPPGTGKTTRICNKINEILKVNPHAKFLVLTPTNKAADVICNKLLKINSNINVVRLSSPTDPELEESIYREVVDIEEMDRIKVVATTVHRLPYYEIQNASLLFQYEWDYVIFDESSMIGLHYITFALMALYKTNQYIRFIISGDPKQIPPVVEIDDTELENFDYQDENIYKMMGLDSFDPKEQSIRVNDSIVNLPTQYRSIPQIGQLFSELSYSNQLKHEREINGKLCRQLPKDFKSIISSNVTFIDIPLDRCNSVYDIKKLFYSSYHIYSAILVTEIIKYFDSLNNEKWRIGVISPYKAQAMLINKLITSSNLSDNTIVLSDTVHGFQGDECDIVFFVCNPNNYYYTGHVKSLLSKEYIYNVAISRAKDYLIVLHPFSAIPNNEFIKNIGSSYIRNFGNEKIKHSEDVERFLFKERKYFIVNDSYVSGHDNVNVFRHSSLKYFIKTNDTAIDIQLRDKNDTFKGTMLDEISYTTIDIQSSNIEDISTIDDKIEESNFIETEVPFIEGVKVVGKIDLSQFEKYKKKQNKERN
ncbi:MAG: AAA domain-containing protein [Porphyromonadaceae bacterium]|nr:AAA domain-containing protein [Porphyromonadaceae bacterium]